MQAVNTHSTPTLKQRVFRWGKRILLGLVALLALVILVVFIALSRGLVHYPALTGQYQVGRADYHLIDTDRPEIFSEDPDDVRELMATVYYPAAVPADAQPAPVTSGLLRTAVAQKAGVPEILQDSIRAHAFTDVPIAGDGDFPVLVFSPGMGYIPMFYIPTLEEVASHGFIVVSLYHPYSTFATPFPDGRIVASASDAGSRALSQITAAATTEDEFALVVNRIGSVWVADITFVIDELERMNLDDSLLGGHLDLERLGVFGHSFGGGAAVEALYSDDRVRAAANLDGSMFGQSAHAGVARPVMLMLSEEQADLTADLLIAGGADSANAEFIVDRGQSTINTVISHADPGYRVVLAGSKHVTYITGSSLAAAISFAPPDAYGKIPVERAHQIISAYVVTFFNQYLSGYVQSVEVTTLDFPETVVTVGN